MLATTTALTLHQEKFILQNTPQYKRIVGIDEVGRGALAGPVAVGAYIITLDTTQIMGVRDSKRTSPAQRQELYSRLQESSSFSVRFAPPAEIDVLGVGKTIERLILDFVNIYHDERTLFLIDGLFQQNFGRHAVTITGGDNSYYAIAAAAIMAKVERDQVMVALEQEYPQYDFASHKGYGTATHLERLQQYGLSPLHRRSFSPVRQLVDLPPATT